MDEDDCAADCVTSIEEQAKKITLNLLPAKSRALYEKTYNEFVKWCKDNNVQAATEDSMLVYFDELCKVYKPSSLWSKYSMIRANLVAKENIDISQFKKLFAFLKRQSEGYKPKKSKILTREEIIKFFVEAPDENFLMIKVSKKSNF